MLRRWDRYFVQSTHGLTQNWVYPEFDCPRSFSQKGTPVIESSFLLYHLTKLSAIERWSSINLSYRLNLYFPAHLSSVGELILVLWHHIFKWDPVYKILNIGLPWWRSGWESACRCRGHGFEPWSGKIPHAAEQLGPWATITERARLEPVLRNKRGRDSERPAHCDEEWRPLAATRESPRTETKTQHSQKNKY